MFSEQSLTKYLGATILFLVISCQSVINGNSQQKLYTEVFDEIMLSDPLLQHALSVTPTILSPFDKNTVSENFNSNEWSLASSEQLKKALELRSNYAEPDPNLEALIFYLKDVAERKDFLLHQYPLSSDKGIHKDALIHFTNRVISSKNEVEDYLDDLLQLEQHFKQLIDELEIRRKNGIVAPSTILRSARLICDSIVRIPIERNAMFTSYQEKLNAIGLLEPGKKESYMQSCQKILMESVIPSYVRLSNYLAQLEETSLNVAGAWRLENGEAFYNNCLKWHTGLSISTDSVYRIAKEELARLTPNITEDDRTQSKIVSEFLEIEFPENSPLFRKVLPTEAHKNGFALYKKVRSGDLVANRLATTKLIIDIGIHHKRWLKEQAVRYLISMADVKKSAAEKIVNESISDPGAITTDKIGQLVIQLLREENPKMSDEEFEKRITRHGPLPLGVLVKISSENNQTVAIN